MSAEFPKGEFLNSRGYDRLSQGSLRQETVDEPPRLHFN